MKLEKIELEALYLLLSRINTKSDIEKTINKNILKALLKEAKKEEKNITQ